jgi:hypothetical protein
VLHEKLTNLDKYTTDRGVMTIERPAPHVMVVRGHGYAEAAFTGPVLAARDAIIDERGHIALFDDLERVTGYDSEVRTRLTGWASEHRRQIVAFHILTRSRLVAMGVAVASVALGGHIRAHTQRSAFERALVDEVHRDHRATAS